MGIARGRMAKAMVLRGSKGKTVGGLTAKDLVKSKYGKIVSKKRSALAKKSPRIVACKKARAALKIKGFSAIKKGSPLYLKAKEFTTRECSAVATSRASGACESASSGCGDFCTC